MFGMVGNEMAVRICSALLCAGLCVVADSAAARTIHRSFRTREVGVGGGFGVAIPVDRRVDKAIDEARVPKKDHVKLFTGEKVKNAKTNTVRVVRRRKVVKPKPAVRKGGNEAL